MVSGRRATHHSTASADFEHAEDVVVAGGGGVPVDNRRIVGAGAAAAGDVDTAALAFAVAEAGGSGPPMASLPVTVLPSMVRSARASTKTPPPRPQVSPLTSNAGPVGGLLGGKGPTGRFDSVPSIPEGDPAYKIKIGRSGG